MTESSFVTCAHCSAKNRIPTAKLTASPKCGKCKQAVLTPNPIELDDSNFQHFIQNNDMPIVVDFWADWCGPCKMMAPTFSAVSQDNFEQVRFVKVDTGLAQQTAGLYQIRSIPTLILFRNGKEVTRQAGAMDKTNLQGWLQSIL